MLSPSLDKTISNRGLAYHQSGSGPALLLVHGVGMCADSWFQQIEGLCNHFNVYAIDLPGHGASQELATPFEEVGLADFVDAVFLFASEVIADDYFICGHSLGALIAAELAVRDGSSIIASLALSAVYQRCEGASEAVQARAARLQQSAEIVGVEQTLDRWFGTPPPAPLRRYAGMCYNWLQANAVSGYAKAYKAFADLPGVAEQSLQSWTQPTIFMTGDEDPNSTPEMSQALATNNDAHHAVVVHGAGHMLPLTHAEILNEQLLSMNTYVRD